MLLVLYSGPLGARWQRCAVLAQKKEKYPCLDSLKQLWQILVCNSRWVVRWGRGANLSFTQRFGCFKWWQPTHSTLLFQGGQRPLQKKGSPVPSTQRAVPRAPRGGPLPPQSLRLQRQQQGLLTRQSQEPAISLTARQEYVELRVSLPLMQRGTHLCPSWHERNLTI